MFKPSTCLLLPLLALGVLADSQQANPPTSSDSSAQFEQSPGSSGSWSAASSSAVDISSTPVSWRLAGDSGSSVELSYDSSKSLQGYGGADIALTVTTTVNTTYGGSSSSSSQSTVPLTRTLRILNQYCQYSQNFTALVQYTNGSTTSQTKLDDLTIAVPDGVNIVNVTQVDTHGIVTDTTTLQYGNDAPITAVYGSGSNVPSVSATVYAELDYCTEDD